MPEENNNHVSRGEFTQFQGHVMQEFKNLHHNDAKMIEALEKVNTQLHAQTRPNFQVILGVLAVVMSSVALVGGLVAFTFKSENENLRQMVERTEHRLELIIERELDELSERRQESRTRVIP